MEANATGMEVGLVEGVSAPAFLGLDELVQVCSFLPLHDILALSTTDRTHRQVLHDSPLVWCEILREHRPDLLESYRRHNPNVLLTSSPPTGSERTSLHQDSGVKARRLVTHHVLKDYRWQRGRPAKVTKHMLAVNDVAPEAIQSLDYGNDCLLVASGDQAHVTSFDEAGELQVRVTLPQSNTKVNNIKCCADYIVTAGMDHLTRLFDWNEGREVWRGELHNSAVWGLDIDRTSQLLATAGYATVTVVDPRVALPPFTFRAHSTWVRAIQVDVSRNIMVTGSCDASCKLWDLRTGQQLGKFVHPNHFEEVRSVHALDGDDLVTGCYDGFVRKYDLLTGKLKQIMADHEGFAVECLNVGQEHILSLDWRGVINYTPWGQGQGHRSTRLGDLLYGPETKVRRVPQSKGSHIYSLAPILREGALDYTLLDFGTSVHSLGDGSTFSSVCSMHATADRVLVGQKDGGIVQIHF